MDLFFANMRYIIGIALIFYLTLFVIHEIKHNKKHSKRIQTLLVVLTMFCGAGINAWQIGYLVNTPNKVKVADQKAMQHYHDGIGYNCNAK